MQTFGVPERWLDALKEVAGLDMLWDVVVRQVSMRDWEIALEGVRQLADTSPSIRITEDVAGPLGEAFEHGGSDPRISLLLSEEAEVHAHFFALDEIEFDVDPRQLHNRSGNALLEFMRALGKSTMRPCLLTPENVHDRAMMRYDPASDAFSLS